MANWLTNSKYCGRRRIDTATAHSDTAVSGPVTAERTQRIVLAQRGQEHAGANFLLRWLHSGGHGWELFSVQC